MRPFNTRQTSLAAAAALAGVMAGAADVGADLNIISDTVVDGSMLAIDPPGGLFVSHESNDPLLTLTNGAGSEGIEAVVVGSLAGESGRLLIEGGSALTNSGTGTLGTYGSMTVLRGDAYLGLTVGSTGAAIVSGEGSEWTNSRNLYVGYFGTGAVTIEAGGSVAAGSGVIGFTEESIASAVVTDVGSTWINSNALYVGYRGVLPHFP
jgi:fibronectin-binding autotransporter adhesin